MDKDKDGWISTVSELQDRIALRLSNVGFHDHDGTIAHHLAEVVYLGGRLAENDLPAFLNLPVKEGDALGEIVVGLVNDLDEIKEAIIEMEKAMVQLMNHLTK